MPSRFRVLAVLSAFAVLGGCGQSPPAENPSTNPSPVVAASQSPSGASPTPGTTGVSPTSADPTTTPSAVRELPRGGTSIFPEYRLFGYSGSPLSPGQGRMGIGKLDDRLAELEVRSKPFLGGRKLMPIMELIATTVHPVPGPEGKFRTHEKDSVIRRWLAAARRHKAMLLLNIQPGTANFLDEAKFYEKWLREPDVGLALDPEWAVNPGQIPGRVFGSTTAAELNSVGEWVSSLVAANGLPEKVIVFHQLRPDIVRHEKQLKRWPGVVWIKSIDGIGPPGAKVATYKRVSKSTPAFVHSGFKLFYQEDVQTGGRLMTGKEVLALRPRAEYVLFE